ncbi:MAG: hypothetical protein EYC70_02640 [Planctomycetota bacterium]|nr:MAG: hypothetical protein EYC70_02640 [Planctomycetota bacterium]
MTDLLAVFGRLHPLLLHLPIGLLAGLVALELVLWARRAIPPAGFMSVWAWMTAASAVVTATAGYVLSREPGYAGETVTNHLRLGIAFAVSSILVAILQSRERYRWAYRVALLASLGLLLPAGHLGATITHGEGFLTEPLRAARPAPDASGDVSTFAGIVQPILEQKCLACHSEAKHKGGLVLHSPETIQAGGFDGPVIVAGDPGRSELMRRLRLPLADEDHMPPDGKPQPTAQEIAAIEAWIAAGAPFEGVVTAIVQPVPVSETPQPVDPAATVAPATPQALEALRQQLVHVEPVESGSPLLWVDFAAAAQRTGDAEAQALLDPVRDQVAELSLSRCQISDATVPLLARMPHLRRLDLRTTLVTDAGVAALRNHAVLEELVLAQTRLSEASVDHLLALPALRRLYLWNSGVSGEGVARLRAALPDVVVDAGDRPDAAVVQAEAAIQLTSDAPLPGQEDTPADLKPVNSVCPVSGSPVNPKYSILFNGRVVGFCCPNCPKEFWADPARFEAKLQ